MVNKLIVFLVFIRYIMYKSQRNIIRDWLVRYYNESQEATEFNLMHLHVQHQNYT